MYETSALVPKGAPDSWKKPFLNMAFSIKWGPSLEDLLSKIKKIEKRMGRDLSSKKWAPRIIDIDILAAQSRCENTSKLTVPHPGLFSRDFFLSPLSDITSHFFESEENPSTPVLKLKRKLSSKTPAFMDILNFTPDSFSDGGELQKGGASFLKEKIKRNIENSVQWMDIGGASSRPGSSPVSADEEWMRIEPFFKAFEIGGDSLIKVSVDTFRAEIARKALKKGAFIINDVSGLSDPEMLPLLRNSQCDYVLMHSLSVPADRSLTFSEDQDPVLEIQNWLEKKLELFQKNKIDLSRIIFDPGIGFGKTAQQSLKLIQNVESFFKHPVRIMLGPSRKSFFSIVDEGLSLELKNWKLSMELSRRGVDILRVHEASKHSQAFSRRRNAQNEMTKGLLLSDNV